MCEIEWRFFSGVGKFSRSHQKDPGNLKLSRISKITNLKLARISYGKMGKIKVVKILLIYLSVFSI